ncbi:hypothetical protein ACTMTU_05820 [Streptomyces sp. OZ13]
MVILGGPLLFMWLGAGRGLWVTVGTQGLLLIAAAAWLRAALRQ